jgi:AraC-like DNA-binding protein
MLTLLAPAAATALILMAVLAWSQPGLPGHRQLSASLVVGAAFFLFKAWPEVLMPLSAFVLAGPLALDRANRAVFEAGQRPTIVDTTLLGLLLLTGLTGFAGPRWPYASAIYMALSLLLFLDLPVVVWRSLPDDLVAARRNARLWIMGLGAVLGTAIAIGAALGQGKAATAFGAVATVGLCVAAAGFGRQIVATLAPATPPPAVALDAREELILCRLRQLANQGAYTDPGLTLSRLAQRLEVPEHRLRRVIHVGEGQRNFSAWLNCIRITAVKAEMMERPDATVLELAVEAGYASLSVFNRAFKAAEGVTPTAWRSASVRASKAKTPETISDA